MDEILHELKTALMAGQAPLVKDLVQRGLDQGLDPSLIMDKGLVAAMSVIGRKFKADEIYIPEVMIAARAMNAGLEVLDPILSRTGAKPRGTVVLGTVHGDLHDVGKNMVSMMFRGGGYKVVDLGVDVPEASFVEAINREEPQIVALSALLTMTLPAMKATVKAIEEAGVRTQVAIMVGGAPVTDAYAEQIGADGWAPDAASAVEKADTLLSARSL